MCTVCCSTSIKRAVYLRLPSPPPLISVLCLPTFLSWPTSALTLTPSIPYLSMTAMAPTIINPHPQFYAFTFMAQMKGCPICYTDSGNHTCKFLPCSYVHSIVPSTSAIVQLLLSSIMVMTTTLKVSPSWRPNTERCKSDGNCLYGDQCYVLILLWEKGAPCIAGQHNYLL